MSRLRITPELIEGIYNMLKTIPPFRKLPDSDAVKFVITRSKSVHGICVEESGEYSIHISEKTQGHLATVIATVAHECCHLLVFQRGTDTKSMHGASWQRIAKSVASKLGFDPKAF
jgi:hypothetical protein